MAVHEVMCGGPARKLAHDGHHVLVPLVDERRHQRRELPPQLLEGLFEELRCV